MRIQLDTHLWIPNEPDFQSVLDTFRLRNPAFDLDALVQPAGMDAWIRPWIHRDSEIGLERGLGARFLKILRNRKIDFRLDDRRIKVPIDWSPYQGPPLRPAQEAGISRAIRSGGGILILPTGAGKTLTALEFARRAGQRTLIITPRNELASQWVDEARNLFGISDDGIGRISDGHRDVGRILTLAHPQSLVVGGALDGIEKRFGTVILDECQYGAAETYHTAVTSFPAHYRLGVSANPARMDCMEGVIGAVFGPVVLRRERIDSERTGSVLPVGLRIIPYESHRLVPKNTAMRERAFLKDPIRMERLDWIISIAEKPALIIVRLRESVELVRDRLQATGLVIGRMVGRKSVTDKRDFKTAMTGLIDGSLDLAVATWSACGVGTNIPTLQSLIMATPPGRGDRGYLAFNQNRGRASRVSAGKTDPNLYLIWDRGRVGGVAYQCWEWNDKRAEIWDERNGVWRVAEEKDLAG